MSEEKHDMIVAFNPNDYMWSKDDFRGLIKLMNEDEHTVLYLISDSSDTLVDDVKRELALDDAFVFQFTTEAEIADKVEELNVLLFLSNSQPLNDLINSTNTISLVESNVTGCEAITVNNIQDHTKIQPKYHTKLEFWTEQIKKFW